MKPGAGEPLLIPLGSHAGAAPIVMKRPTTVIGSRKDIVRLHLESSTVSKAHAVIVLNDWGCYIHDLGSRTHTWVNGKQVVDHSLVNGDQIQIGRFQFKYVAPPGAKAPPPPLPPGELVVTTLTDPLPLTKRVIQIGRRQGSDLQFDDDAVSNIHAIIFERNGKRYVRDFSSRTGTWLDGKPAHQELLDDGVLLKVGPAVIKYRESGAPAVEQTSLGAMPLEVEPPQIAMEPDEAIEPALDSSVAPLELDLDLEPSTSEKPRGIPLDDELDLNLAGETNELEPTAEAPAAEDEDALAGLRRGWRTPRAGEKPKAKPPLPPIAAPLPLEEPAEIKPPAAEAKPLELEPEEIKEALDLPLEIEPIKIDSAIPPPLELEPIDIEPVKDEAVLEPTEPDIEEMAEAALEAPAEPVVHATDAEIDEEDEQSALERAALLDEPDARSPVIEEIAEAAVAPSNGAEPTIEVEDEAETAAPPEQAEFTLDLDDELAESVDDVLPLDAPSAEAPKPATLAEEALVEESDEYVVGEVSPTVASSDDVDLDDLLPTETAAAVETPAQPPFAEAVEEESDEGLAVAEPLPTADAPSQVKGETRAEAPNEAVDRGAIPGATQSVPMIEVIEDTRPPIDEIIDDDGAIDLDPSPRLPIAESIAEPVVDLEGDESELIEPERPAREASDAIDLDDLLDDVEAEDETPDEPTPAAAAAAASTSIPEVDLSGEWFKSESGKEVDGDAPTVDATKEEVSADLEAPAPIDDLAAIDFSNLKLDEIESDEDEVVDALDDEENEVASIDLSDTATGSAHDLVGQDSEIEVVEETHPTLDSAILTEADLDSLEGDLTDAQLRQSLSDLPAGDGGEPVDAEDDAAVPAAPQATKPDTDYGDDIIPPSEGKLSDLIPSGPPMMGGTFAPQPQQFVVGGSPMVGLTGPATPPKPPQRGADAGDADRRRPLRVGFEQKQAPSASSPFSGEKRTIEDVLIGRRAAASVDVFASPSPTPEDLLMEAGDNANGAAKDTVNGAAGATSNGAASADESPVDAEDREAELGSLSTEERELMETAERFRPRGAIRATDPAAAGNNIPATNAPEPVDPAAQAKLRRTRLRRVLWCTLLLVPLIGAAVAAIMMYVPVTSDVVATITYKGMDSLKDRDLIDTRATQLDLLTREPTRVAALNALDPNVPPGFLGDLIQFPKAVEPKWSTEKPSLLRLHVRSTDKKNDGPRLRALADALIAQNKPRIDRFEGLRQELKAYETQIQVKTAEMEDLRREILALNTLGDTRPDRKALDEIQAKVDQADGELRAAKSRRQEAEAAIDLLTRQAPSELAPSPEADLSRADEQLNKLNAQLSELQKQNDANRAAATARGAEARKALDGMITEFQKELESAQKLKDNPELVQYVEAAKRIFTQTRQLTDDLIRRQEQQHTRLTELKQKLGARIESHTKEMLEKDEELKKLNDRLAILTRQANAATAEGLKSESDKIALDIKLVQALIKGREELYTKDPVYLDTIATLQQIIDQTQNSIQDDRKHIDQTLTQAQEEFLKNGPAVEKLPAAQKELAESIERKLQAVSEARKAYAAAAEGAEADLAKQEKALKEKVAALQLEMSARQQEVRADAQAKQAVVAEENRKKRLEEKKAELAMLNIAEKKAQEASDQMVAERDRMRAIVADWQQSDGKRMQKETQLAQAGDEIKRISQSISPRQMELATIVVPEQTVEMQTHDEPDHRTLYAGTAAGALFLLMLIPIVWNLRLVARDSHHPSIVKANAPSNGFAPVMPVAAAADEPEIELTQDEDPVDEPQDEHAIVR